MTGLWEQRERHLDDCGYSLLAVLLVLYSELVVENEDFGEGRSVPTYWLTSKQLLRLEKIVRQRTRADAQKEGMKRVTRAVLLFLK